MKRLLCLFLVIGVALLEACNSENIVDDTNINNDEVGVQQKQDNTKISFEEFSIALSGDTLSSEDRVIVGKDSNGNWHEIIKIKNPQIIGRLDEKLFFDDEDGIYSIDLSQQPYSKDLIITYREYEEYMNDYPITVKERISNPHMYGEDIYFNYSSYAGGTDTKDGIQKLNINGKSLDDAISINPDVSLDDWTIDNNNNSLYYLKFGFGAGDTLYRYDLVNNVTEELFKNVEDFDIRDNKMLYYVWNNHIDSGDKYGHYDLYLYNLDTKENTYITKTNAEDIKSGNLWSYAEYRNNSVYYKSGDSIVKYNDGNREVLYTYSIEDGGTEFYGFDLISDDVIELVLQMTKNEYLKDGIIYETYPDETLSNVIMSDGTILKLRVLDND